LKSNKGVTLTSLIIYIIGLVIVVALMGTFTGYFYKNVSDVTMKQKAEEQYAKLLSYLTKDVNSDKLKFVQSGEDPLDCLIFKYDDGIEHQYIYQDENIYYLDINNQNEKKILLCNKVLTSSKVFTYIEGKVYLNCNINKQDFSKTLSVKIQD
jgi:hypothetical protein